LSKDQAIGGIIFTVCFVTAILYVVTLFYPQWLETLRIQTPQTNIQFWIIATPVFIAFVAVTGIGAWIGWTMATTPQPKPIEETTSETEKEKEPEKT